MPAGRPVLYKNKEELSKVVEEYFDYCDNKTKEVEILIDKAAQADIARRAKERQKALDDWKRDIEAAKRGEKR